jgi:hypothetical protein
MRTLFEIVEGARDGNKPTHDECYFAMLMLDALLGMDHRDLRDVCLAPTPVRCSLKLDGSFKRFKAGLDADPQKWLGTQVPGNPEYDRMRKAAFALLAKVEAQEKAKDGC